VSGNRSIVLEIYGLKGGRWSIHANYSIKEREDCLEDAKELDAKGRFEAVCVVRETYNEKDNSARQAVIYHSPKLPSPPPVAIVTEGLDTAPKPDAAPQKKSGDGEGAWRKKGEEKKKSKEAKKPAKKDAKKPSKKAAAPAKNAKKTKPEAKPVRSYDDDGPSLADVLPKLLAVAGISFFGALAIAYTIYLLLPLLPAAGIMLGRTMSQSIIVTVFIASFIFIFVPLLKRFVPTIRASKKAEPLLATTTQGPVPDTALQREATAVEPSKGAPASVTPVAPPPVSESDGMSTDPYGSDPLVTIPELNRSSSEENNEDSVESDEGVVSSEEASPGDGAKLQKKPDVSAEIMKFIRDSLEPLAKAGHELNPFNRFGLTLYFSGAGQYMATRYKVSDQEMTSILCAHMQVLGHNAEMARGFCANIDEYLVNPKYFQMYEKGRTALGAAQGNPNGESTIVEAIEDWSKPAPVTSKSDKEFVAVLFTDIVGSTALTQERGDDAAQLVVHEHNSIVRDALALHRGKEIKHTGDGIMATFSQITDAVEGAMAMQQACTRANNSNPSLGLGLCIGVNAGEPIHEDGDIFGTPVQMAARVLSKAEGEEIAVSNLVREMCTGKNYKFSKKGEYELKGFPEPVPIFLMDWSVGLNTPEKPS
jgi:class 3 adenylate cyclase